MGIADMAVSKSLSKTKSKLLQRWFGEMSDATAETVEILMDIEQVSDLLSSFEDVRKGALVSMESSFGDLS